MRNSQLTLPDRITEVLNKRRRAGRKAIAEADEDRKEYDEGTVEYSDGVKAEVAKDLEEIKMATAR